MSNNDFLAIDDVDPSREVLETAIDALALEGVDALCFVRLEEIAVDGRRIFGEVSRFGVGHRHVRLASIVFHCASELETAFKHLR